MRASLACSSLNRGNFHNHSSFSASLQPASAFGTNRHPSPPHPHWHLVALSKFSASGGAIFGISQRRWRRRRRRRRQRTLQYRTNCVRYSCFQSMKFSEGGGKGRIRDGERVVSFLPYRRCRAMGDDDVYLHYSLAKFRRRCRWCIGKFVSRNTWDWTSNWLCK